MDKLKLIKLGYARGYPYSRLAYLGKLLHLPAAEIPTETEYDKYCEYMNWVL